MAAGGFKEFVAGETLDQDEINDFLMQGVLVFAGTAARGSAITAPVEGQFAYLKDSDTVEFYDSTQWVPLSAGLGAAVVDSTTGSPTVTSGTTIGGTAYDIYAFTGSGSIIIDEAGLVDFLLIGGGASGGAMIGAGGGAGGHESLNQAFLPAGTATVTVGAGGASSVVSLSMQPRHGQNGFGSKLGPYVVPGGGAGAALGAARDSGDFRSHPGFLGGSGGGSSGYIEGSSAAAGGVSISGLGNSGGVGGDNRGGGGGGGAGAVGSNGSGQNGGNGGAGVANSITGSSVTRAGGGGGSGPLSGSVQGTGGTGGGGNAGLSTGSAGTVNTGGGGGGAGSTGSSTASGAGGSGLVIVRVAV